MFSIPFILITCSLTLYYTYKIAWFHIISLFESFNSSNYQSRRESSSPSTPASFLQPKSPHSSQFFKTLLDYDFDQNKLVKNIKHLSRLVFAITITSIVLVIEFILFQSFNKADTEVDSFELILWEIGVYSLIINLGFIQPFIITFLIINKFYKSNQIRFGLSCGIVTIWLLFILKFDKFTDFKHINFDDVNYSSKLLYKLAIIGITLIAILNGIGSFSTAYYYLYRTIFHKDSDLINQDEESIRQKLLDLNKTFINTENLINSKRVEQSNVEVNENNSSQLQKRTNIQPKGSFLDLTTYFITSPNSEDDELQNEIKSLTLVKNDIYIKIQKYETYLNSKSTNELQANQAKIINLIKKSLALYCFFKILQVAIVKIISIGRYYRDQDSINTNESDPLVITIAKILQIFITVEDDDFLVNQLSFIVSGGLFICSFNGVFMTLTHLYKFIPIDLSNLSNSKSNKNKKSVSIIKNLFVSELLGIYVLATMFILRSNLTRSFSSKLNYLFNLNNSSHGSSDYQIIDNWFDKIFLLSVLVTATSIKIGEILTIDDGFENHELLNKVV